MISNVVFLLTITNCFWILCYGEYFSTKHCTGYGEELYFDIVCNDPVRFPNDLPKTTEKLTIICSENGRNNNMTMSNISINDVKPYNMLITIIIEGCPIEELPEKLFSNMKFLQSVILNNIPIRRLRNIFYKSENILDLILINLFNLEHIDHHILYSQNSFSKITLDNTTIPMDNLKNVLMPVRKHLKEFRFINNVQEMIEIPKEFFREYQLGLLDLQNNYFRDWSFLKIIKSRKTILTNSRVATSTFDVSLFKFLHIFCQMLDVENIGIEGTFPITISSSYEHIKILILKSNTIETLNNKMNEMFPRLELLDISFNRIKHLQPELNNLFFKADFFKLEGNPLHCNCQLRWLSARYKSKIKDYPRCNFDYRSSNITDKSNLIDNIYFSQLTTDSLICLPPKTPILTISRGKKPTQLITSDNNTSEKASELKKEYTLIMDDNQQVELMCETEGDPTPTLTWSDQIGTLLTRNASSQMDPSSSNRITVGLGGPNVSSIYLCTASNIEGISYALLNLISKKNVDFETNSKPIYERIRYNQNTKNCATKLFAQFFEFKSVVCLISKIFIFYYLYYK